MTVPLLLATDRPVKGTALWASVRIQRSILLAGRFLGRKKEVHDS